MLDALAAANLPHRSARPRSFDPRAEDRYYRSHQPRRWGAFPILPLVAILGLIAVILDISTR